MGTKTAKDQGLRVAVVGGRLVISIGVDALAHAFQETEFAKPFDETIADWRQRWHVTSADHFARDVRTALECESEDGSTPISDLLDKACVDAVEDGSMGTEEVKP